MRKIVYIGIIFPFLFMPRYFMLFGTYEEIVVENIGAIYCSTITRPVIN